MMILALVVAVGLAAQESSPSRDLERVRSLYAAAAYEEALSTVAAMDAARVTADVERVRALCLLALGRRAEAVQSFERLVSLAPGYLLGPDSASPQVIEIFDQTRARVFAAVLRERYARGRASFEAKAYARAATELEEVVTLIKSSPAGIDVHGDLEQLASGFLRLAELEVAAERAAARAAGEARAAAPSAEALQRAAASPPADPGFVIVPIVIYSTADADVRPPIEIERSMPAWNPVAGMARTEFRGQIEVIIDETGRVEQARMVKPLVSSYDVTLIAATRRWRYRPAVRQGEAVKYRLLIDVVLSPRQ